ncbi:hypothetical protein AAFF_G00009240 [Aldrovandia affinis]|uniref:Uncharacterized protein n=1 Tax=Aldrovandia affinis TaxID=143900 RepID=A0AAD7WZ99_9TELE|nr:hypothetical protein AAFF_G00009240 [Aldrovandia affinis]
MLPAIEKDINIDSTEVINIFKHMANRRLLAECDAPPVSSSHSTGPYWENWLRLEGGRPQWQARKQHSTSPAQQR